MSELTGTHSEVAAYECKAPFATSLLTSQSQPLQLCLVFCSIEGPKYK
jgi:hypothetical protein